MILHPVTEQVRRLTDDAADPTFAAVAEPAPMSACTLYWLARFSLDDSQAANRVLAMRKADEIARRRAMAFALDCWGFADGEIADKFGVSVRVVRADLAIMRALHKRWRHSPGRREPRRRVPARRVA
jgi:hypothetical protein